MKIFDLYETKEIKVVDAGLKKYINFDEKLVLKSHGRRREKFGMQQVNIIERLASYLGVPGHRGKKHKIQTSWASGKYNKHMKIVLKALEIIEEKTKQNPVQVLVKAVENASPCEEITTIEYGGARYPQAVDMSPMRRISFALRNLVHGAYDKSFGKKPKIESTLALEIIKASEGNNEAAAIQKKIEAEKQADSAR